MNHKKFIFGALAMVCVSTVSIFLKYDGDTYLKLVGAIVAVYLSAQTLHDIKK